MNNLLEIKDLSKNYYTKNGEIKALESINLEVYEGEFLCIIGSSGCGKSTLLSILSGLESPTAGNVIWNNTNPKIGYMLQQDALFPWLTVYENAVLGLKILKEATETNRQYVYHLLKEYGLEKFINKYPKELSGGMKQRVGWIQYRHR